RPTPSGSNRPAAQPPGLMGTRGGGGNSGMALPPGRPPPPPPPVSAAGASAEPPSCGRSASDGVGSFHTNTTINSVRWRVFLFSASLDVSVTGPPRKPGNVGPVLMPDLPAPNTPILGGG